jgi:sulfotransferase family protein
VLNTFPSQSSIVASILAQAHAMRWRRGTYGGVGSAHAQAGLVADRPHLPIPFIVGSTGSGTSLLRSMLDSHPRLAVAPATGFLPRALGTLFGNDERQRRSFSAALINSSLATAGWRDFGIESQDLMSALEAITPFRVDEAIRCFYRLYATRFGKDRWGDRTPDYGRHLRAIEQVLPEACFIHVVRDGRDVALSLCDSGLAARTDMGMLARQWRRNICATRRQSLGVRHYLELRYESLVLEPETCLRDICDFIEIDYHPAIRRGLRSLDVSRLSRWRKDMQPRERAGYEGVAGGLLAALDYPVGDV